jgi:hypothetical protein
MKKDGGERYDTKKMNAKQKADLPIVVDHLVSINGFYQLIFACVLSVLCSCST